MGGSPSKAPLVQAPGFDYTKASANVLDLQAYEDQVSAAASEANQALQSALAQASTYKGYASFLFWVLLFGGIIYVGYYYVYPFIVSHWPRKMDETVKKDLSVTSAMVGSTDVKQKVIDKISGNELHIQVDESVGASEGTELVVTYQYPNEVPGSVTAKFGKPMDIVSSAKTEGTTAAAASSSWWNTKNFLATYKDAKDSSTVSIPDNSPQGAYGYQFWMYVSDWNYRFGQEKNIMLRSDASNSAIMNPLVSLHPTDNTMKISVSIFPNDNTSSKTEPAPAGFSGSTDDVYLCEIPNIPLQTWLAVAITVSSRNLDVYLNGKLVKSCFLSGVPKQVAGSVTLNNDGGFSGYMCSFFHYAKLLLPSDAQSFYNSGVPCNVPGTTSNYKVTFGVKDTKGTTVSKYML